MIYIMVDDLQMIYVYDGTWDGLMCLVHRTAQDERIPREILRPADLEGGFLFEAATVENDPQVAAATATVLKKRVSARLLSWVWFALLSHDGHREGRNVDMAIWQALARSWALWKIGKRGEMDLADDYIHVVRRAASLTSGEYNKYLGLTRFKDVGGIFYAELEPDRDVLTLLADHFSARLSDQKWVIHDLRRKKAAVYDTGAAKWFITDMDIPRAPSPTAQEKEIQELWREFYRSTTTRQRLNYRTQRGHMPKKYWKHLVETPNEGRDGP
jgi:probable DNA metabolism protein